MLLMAAALGSACSSGGSDGANEPGDSGQGSTANACKAAQAAVLETQNAQDLRDMSLSWQPTVRAAASAASDAGARELADQLTELDQAMASIRATTSSPEERAKAARTAVVLHLEVPTTCAGLGTPFSFGNEQSPATTASATSGGG
jgi:hypothetical protein